MSRAHPQPDCHDLPFAARHPVDDLAEVALEDYARALFRAAAAEAVRAPEAPGAVQSVHLCGLAAAPTPAMQADLEAFARSLASGAGGGLGWS